MHATDCIFTDPERLLENPVVEARIRYRSPAAKATLRIEGTTAELTFTQPVWGVTPGQSLVLYQDGLVVGGGLIC